MPSLTQAIKDEARRLGFALAGVTTAEPPPHWSTYENWLTEGRNAQMAYLQDERARARRREPRAILPECRSILALAAPYPDPRSAEPAAPDPGSSPHGQVAAYAWGNDYHLILAERLKALATFIERQVGSQVPVRAYTDTGPLLERDLAQRAGLGWIGRNTCLIHPQMGSYLLLAELLLGVELELDAPFLADRCGTCTRCIQACPTGCLLADRTLDARRCISYLTIEHRQAIPPDLRASLGMWVFGCDICQIVCPWNRFADAQGDAAFAPRPGVSRPDLIIDLALSPQAFNRKFKRSPLQRTRRRGYLRNLATALGNSGNPMAIPALERLVREADPLLREHAAWALEQIRKGGTGRPPDFG